jgi:hypothetical protein
VYVWDAISGAPLLRLTGHRAMVTSVAWGPDGATLASAGGTGGELFIWDVERGQRLRSLEGHAGAVCELAWDPGGELLISAAHDGTLRWWEARSGRCVRARQAHQGPVQSLRRSPDGTKLATCGDDGAVTVWELQSGASIQTLRRDRPYERLDITAIEGLTEAQLAMVRALGAVERAGPERSPPGDGSAAGDGAHPQARALNQQRPAASLPFQPISFIGRGAELAKIARLIAEPACRLLTLLGPGGMGKTRLAIELASRQLAQFADGAAFVALASISRPTQIATAIGEALGLAFAGQADLATQLIGSLRDRRLLLVLDNFEHLLGGAELVSAILAGAPSVTILVTSRVRLDLQAEWLYDVEGLS